MARQLISSGSPFEEVAGYSRAVADGDWVFVSGTSGYHDGELADDVEVQAECAFRTIGAALASAESSLHDVVRVRVFITEASYFEKVARVCGRYLKESKPANTTIVCALIDPRMKVEIEVTAKRRKD